MTKPVLFVSMGAITALAASTAAAQGAVVIDDPYAVCSEIAEDGERLACFDATHARQRVVLVERAEDRAERVLEEFGLSDIQLAERQERERRRAERIAARGLSNAGAGSRPQDSYDDGDEDDKPTSITSAVLEVFTDGERRRVVVLDNGQMWRETSNSSWRGVIEPGWEATVSKRWSGGYRLKFGDRRGYLGVSRIR